METGLLARSTEEGLLDRSRSRSFFFDKDNNHDNHRSSRSHAACCTANYFPHPDLFESTASIGLISGDTPVVFFVRYSLHDKRPPESPTNLSHKRIFNHIVGWQAVWSRGGGGLTEERESDVSATSLEGTVRIPPEHWPDLLVVTAAGLRTDALAPDTLDKV